MAEKKVTVRIAMEGGKVVEAQLMGLGAAGEKAMTRIGNSSRQMGGGLQNVGYQVQDFAVQVAGGTDATRAMAQQLPQLLSGFGLFGVLAGTAAAVLVPLARYLWDVEPPAKAAETAVRDLEKAMSDLRSADQEARTPFADLQEKYGAQAAGARELLEIERQLAEVKANRAFSTSAGAVAKAFGASDGSKPVDQLAAELAVVAQLQQEYARLTGEIEALSASGTANAGQRMDSLLLDRDEIQARIDAFGGLAPAIDAIADSFGTTNAEAQRLVELAGAIGASDTTEQRAEATRALAVAIFDSTDGLRLANDEGLTLYQTLLDSALAGGELERLNIAAGIGAGADEAARLAGNLWTAAQNAWSVVTARGAAAQAADKYVADNQVGGTAYLANQYAQYGQGRAAMDAAAKASDDLYGPPAGSVGAASSGAGAAGGGGGGSAQNDMMRAAERLYEQTRTEAEKYTAEVSKLDEMLAAGAINQELYNRGLEAAQEKYGEATGVAALFKEMNIDLKEVMLDLATGGVDALDQITEALKRAAAEALLFGSGPIADLFGITSGLFGGSSFLGDLFGGARAKGGPVDPSKFYVVGEKGPELFVPDGPGTIIPNGARAAPMGAPSGGGSGPAPNGQIDVNVNFGAGLDGYVSSVAERVAVRVSHDALSNYDRSILPGRVKAISRDPRRTR